jgi:hypothetical protein
MSSRSPQLFEVTAAGTVKIKLGEHIAADAGCVGNPDDAQAALAQQAGKNPDSCTPFCCPWAEVMFAAELPLAALPWQTSLTRSG